MYRIDIRDYGWAVSHTVDTVDHDDVWQALAANTPYAVAFEGDEAEAVSAACETSIPWLTADALVQAALAIGLHGAAPNGQLVPITSRLALDVDLQHAAGDLGTPDTLLANNLGRLDPALQPLDGGVVTRATFEEHFLASLCVMQVAFRNQPKAEVCDPLFE